MEDVKLTLGDLAERSREEQEINHERIYTYRYVFMLDGKLCIKFVSDILRAHEDFKKNMLEQDSIESCIAEYVCEYDPYFLGYTVTVKKDKKEDNIDEKV